MKNNFKIQLKGCLKMYLLSLTLMTVNSSFISSVKPSCTTCEASVGWLTGQTAGSASFAWEAADGATGYELWYYRHEDNYTSSTMGTGNTSFTITNLNPGTYTFFLNTICVGAILTAPMTGGGVAANNPPQKSGGGI